MIDIATPMNSANATYGHARLAQLGIDQRGEPAPEHERHGDARLRGEDERRGARAQRPGVELEADDEHVEDDAELRDDAERRTRGLRKEVALDAGRDAPRSDGPSRMPDSTSPITGGWPTAATQHGRAGGPR